MKELEPMALPGVWDSQVRPSAVYEEAKLNRELFERGKINCASYKLRAAQIVLGRSA